MVHEAIDTINNFVSIVTRIYEKGADAGFSREEISQQIIRPIARQRGLNKDQVYYLTHRPEIQEKSRRQYEELKEKQNQKTRNIPSPGPALQEALPAEVQALPPASYVQEDSNNKGKDKGKEIVLPERNIPSPSQQIATPETKPETKTGIETKPFITVPVEECELYLIERYDAPLLREWIKKLRNEVKEYSDLDIHNQTLSRFVTMICEMCKTDKNLLNIIVSKIKEEVKRQESIGYKKPNVKYIDKKPGIEQIAYFVIDNKRMGPQLNKMIGGSGQRHSDEYYIIDIGINSPYATAVSSAKQWKARLDASEAKHARIDARRDARIKARQEKINCFLAFPCYVCMIHFVCVFIYY